MDRRNHKPAVACLDQLARGGELLRKVDDFGHVGLLCVTKAAVAKPP